MQELIYHSIYKVSQARGSGSCFYLKDYNLFVTNSHVVEGFRQVALEDHHRNRYPARVILAHPALDVAFLKAESDFFFLPDLPLAKEEAAIGSKIRVAGYPFRHAVYPYGRYCFLSPSIHGRLLPTPNGCRC